MSETHVAGGPAGPLSQQVAEPEDILESLLSSRSNEHTRRAYRADLYDFFRSRYGLDPTPKLVREFLALSPERMSFSLAVYKSELAVRGMSPATVNRRMAAVKALVDHARRLGMTEARVNSAVPGVRTVSYRSTLGLSPREVRLLLARPDRATVKGKRDYALLLLLLENALRSAELRGLRVGDFSVADRTLVLPNRGRADAPHTVTLTPHAAAALTDYLRATDHAEDPDAFLFQACHPAAKGNAITGDGLYKIVNDYVAAAGLQHAISPQRLRDTAIQAALEATQGDVAVVQQLSRHARTEAIVRMQGRRNPEQERVSAMIAAQYGLGETDGGEAGAS